MDASAAFAILAPQEQTAPLVLASPHSGNAYPQELLEASALDALAIRKSEDSFVHELFAAAPRLGAPLLRAEFPRAYVDPNREPYELDPTMFEDALPYYANIRSPRVVAGLGTIARVVANGAEIYNRKLRFADAEQRIATCYRPYHAALQGLIDASLAKFGCCILLDCHSMPSIQRGGQDDAPPPIDMVLGDCFGSSCAGTVIDAAEAALKGMGYAVARNTPYAGGFTTRHYGRPKAGVHALQIEINRRLYMDEDDYSRTAGFRRVARHMTALIGALARLPVESLKP